MKDLKDIKKTIDSANINFLFGAGLSKPFLESLNNIETALAKAEKEKNDVEIQKLRKEYFEKSMLGNLKIVAETVDKNKDEVLQNYEDFYRRINYVVLKRESSILTKQVNIFTTNIDIFSEKALENTGIDFNDGFHGRFNPKYDVGNFKKSYFKKSLHYENTSEIPVFNILKLHGSLSWREKGKEIYLDSVLDQVKEVEDNKNTSKFGDCFKKLMVVNPTEQKFADTLLNQRYYDLLRIFSNELEKENTALFVMGFSFMDAHIYDLTLRAANSNPTLKIYVFSHSAPPSKVYLELEETAKNKNIKILIPEDGKSYDLQNITSDLFDKLVPLKETGSTGDENITPLQKS